MKSHEVIAKALLETGTKIRQVNWPDHRYIIFDGKCWIDENSQWQYPSFGTEPNSWELYKEPPKPVKWRKYALRVKHEDIIRDTCFYKSEDSLWSEWRKDQCKIVKVLGTIEAPESWEDCE